MAARRLRWTVKARWHNIVLRHHHRYLDQLGSGPTLALRQPVRVWWPRPRPSNMTGPREFTFLGVHHHLPDTRAWRHLHWGESWLIQLHRFDDLVAEGSGERTAWHQSLVMEWMRVNRPGRGVGWSSHCLAARIVNLIKWDLAYGKLRDEPAVRHLIVQVRYLQERFAQHARQESAVDVAKALVFAGCFFAGHGEAIRWRRQALRALGRRALRQATAEDLQDLIQLDAVYPGVLPASHVRHWHERLAQATRPS